MENNLSKCPHCGSSAGFYRVCYIKGKTAWHYDFPGFAKNLLEAASMKGVDNSSVYDHLDYRENKTAFCIECDKPIKELYNYFEEEKE